MRDPLFFLTLASGATALALAGCGVLLARQESPEEAAIRRDYHLDDPPPRLFFFAGEIRGSVTFRLEPDAGLEFWSEDPEYLPVAELDGQGRYILRVEACRQDATFWEAFGEKLIIGDDINCTRWIGQFAFRARHGTRCSAPHPDGAKPEGLGPLILWLLDCPESTNHGRAWRPVTTKPAAAP